MDQPPASLIQIKAKMTASRYFPGFSGIQMSQPFHALPLDRQQAPAAYPLVYLHDASITPADWLRFVGGCCRSPSGRAGLIAIRDPRGIIHALFSYRVDLDLRIRKRLCITDLMVAHVAGSQIDAAVAAAARDVSAQFGCQMITIEQPFHFPLHLRMSCPTAEALKRRAHPAASTRLQ
jgi:hypothetical protein